MSLPFVWAMVPAVEEQIGANVDATRSPLSRVGHFGTHIDSTWPHIQQTVYQQIGDLPPDVIRKFSWENASRLYRHLVPADVQKNPEAF